MKTKERHAALTEAARYLHQTEEVEIDDIQSEKDISDPEDGSGCWVRAWVWVPHEELEQWKERQQSADQATG